MSTLMSVVSNMAGCNGFSVRPIENWPDLSLKFDISQLEQQANKLPEEDEITFVDGEVDEISELSCPQCGEDCEDLIEGYCQECTDQNYNELQAHEAQERWWNSLSEEEKKRQVQNQLRFTC